MARREHSVRELKQKLHHKGFDPEQVDAVIEQLLDEGYLSESRFTEAFIRSKAAKGFGPLKIRVELAQRGISEPLITDAFADLADGFWAEVLATLWQKKFAGCFDGSLAAKAKCVRFLQSRGFASHDIFSLIDEQRVEA